MGIFPRFTDIINTNIHTLIDTAEDPAKMVRLMIQAIEENLVSLRSQLTAVIADQKQLQRKEAVSVTQQQQWQKKAELAIMKQRDDLAYAALSEQAKQQQWQQQVSEQLKEFAILMAQQQQTMQRLEKKLMEARLKQQRLQRKSQPVNSTSNTVQQVNEATLSQMEQRFEQMTDDGEPLVEQQMLLQDDKSGQAYHDDIQQKLIALKMKIQQQKD